MNKAMVVWRGIDVNHLVPSLATHAHVSHRIDRAEINANCGVLKGFLQELDAGEAFGEKLR
jgi:hypothetical protein